MSEFEFLDCLRSKYGGQDYALLPQVRNRTGFGGSVRTADALAVSLWPSRGLGVEGFEFKDSRADWRKELKEAAKAEEIGRFCCRWWLVVSEPGIVFEGELPPAWGLIHARDGAAKVIKAAPLREAQPPTWAFVAAVLRAAVDVVTPEAEIARRVQKARGEALDEARASYETKLKGQREHADNQAELVAKSVRAFEEASGVRLDTWGNTAANRRLGEAVRFINAGGLAGLTSELARIAEIAGRVKTQAEQVADVANT